LSYTRTPCSHRGDVDFSLRDFARWLESGERPGTVRGNGRVTL